MSQPEQQELLAERLQAVEDRLRAACRRAGRPRNAVTLVAVTKTVSAEVAALLPPLGVLDLGESRPQELWHKAAILPASVRWHLIGHLQRNKIEQTLPLCTLIHSVDSVRLLEAIDQEAVKRGKFAGGAAGGQRQRRGEQARFRAGGSRRFGDSASGGCGRCAVRGLMTMAAPEDDRRKVPADVRRPAHPARSASKGTGRRCRTCRWA